MSMAHTAEEGVEEVPQAVRAVGAVAVLAMALVATIRASSSRGGHIKGHGSAVPGAEDLPRPVWVGDAGA